RNKVYFKDKSSPSGDAKWDDDLQFTGEFHYTKGYWEWTEDVLSRCREKLRLINAYNIVYASLFTYDHNSDIIKAFSEAWCPLTNTFLTSAGELSILLWDLHDLAGLPMMSCLYDEVIPRALELTGDDEKGGRFIPRSSKYLLYAYHLLQSVDGNQCSNVSIEIHAIEGDIGAHENTPPLDDAMVEDLEFSKKKLEVLKEDLKSLNPFA
ncbi:UNVERIFIED_CONTAM: hypothetical protein Slati_3458800, partial [Sesamum latifolium]